MLEEKYIELVIKLQSMQIDRKLGKPFDDTQFNKIAQQAGYERWQYICKYSLNQLPAVTSALFKTFTTNPVFDSVEDARTYWYEICEAIAYYQTQYDDMAVDPVTSLERCLCK